MYFLGNRPLARIVDNIEGASEINKDSSGERVKTALTLFLNKESLHDAVINHTPEGEDPLKAAREILRLHFEAYENPDIFQHVEVLVNTDQAAEQYEIYLVSNLYETELLQRLGLLKDGAYIHKQVQGNGEHTEKLLNDRNLPYYDITEGKTVRMFHKDALFMNGCFVHKGIKKDHVSFDRYGTGLSFLFSDKETTSSTLDKNTLTNAEAKKLFEHAMKDVLEKEYGSYPSDIKGYHLADYNYELEIENSPEHPDSARINLQFYNADLLDRFLKAFSLEREYKRTHGFTPTEIETDTDSRNHLEM